LEGEGLEM